MSWSGVSITPRPLIQSHAQVTLLKFLSQILLDVGGIFTIIFRKIAHARVHVQTNILHAYAVGYVCNS